MHLSPLSFPSVAWSSTGLYTRHAHTRAHVHVPHAEIHRKVRKASWHQRKKEVVGIL